MALVSPRSGVTFGRSMASQNKTKPAGAYCGALETSTKVLTADSVALGCVALAPHFTYQTLRFSEEIFLKLVVVHTTWL